MDSKKEIGKIFKENLKDLDISPTSKVWEDLETSLDNNKSKNKRFLWLLLPISLISVIFLNHLNEADYEQKNTETKIENGSQQKIILPIQNSKTPTQEPKNKIKKNNSINKTNPTIEKLIIENERSNSTKKKNKYSKEYRVVKDSKNYTEIEVIEKYTISIHRNEKNIKTKTRKKHKTSSAPYKNNITSNRFKKPSNTVKKNHKKHNVKKLNTDKKNQKTIIQISKTKYL